jgi:hypothetical protein
VCFICILVLGFGFGFGFGYKFPDADLRLAATHSTGLVFFDMFCCFVCLFLVDIVVSHSAERTCQDPAVPALPRMARDRRWAHREHVGRARPPGRQGCGVSLW